MIPQHTIQGIRDRAADDIVDIVGEHVQLKRSGSSWKGKCPFHDENTASFSVSPERGIYKCFGCGEGGDAVDFIIKQTGKEFIPVLKELARRFMIDIPDETGSKKRNYGRSNTKIYEAILPGLRDMKNRMRREDKVYLLFDDSYRERISDSAPWLSIELPVSRGQYQIISKYAGDVVLMGNNYDIDALLQSVLNAVRYFTWGIDRKSIEAIFIWAENGNKQSWLNYFMEYHPEKTDAVKNIIIQVPDRIRYEIYQQAFIKYLNQTSNS